MVSGRTGISEYCIATVRPLDDPTRRTRNVTEFGEWQAYKNVTFGLQNDVNDN
jgi:hypothetical protein